MSKYIDTWVTGEVTEGRKLLQLNITDPATGEGWGTAMGLGYAPSLVVRKSGGRTTFATLAGTWTDAVESTCVFTIDATFLPDTGVDEADFEFLTVMTKDGTPTVLDSPDNPWTFKVVRWP